MEQEAPAKAIEASPPRRQSKGSHPPADLPSTVNRSSAWPQQPPQYSSSWPLQSGSQYSAANANQTRRDHGYESEDESDVAADHPPLGNRQHQIQKHAQNMPPQQQQQQQQHHTAQRQHSTPKQHQSQQQQHSKPEQYHHRQQHSQPRLANVEPPRRPHHPARERDDAPPAPNNNNPHRSRQPRASRPIVARTIVSQRSMANMDRGGGVGGASPATTSYEVWRGRPEDWESPYSSSDSDSDYNSDLDGERVPAMKLIEGEPAPRRGGRDSSVSGSYCSRREASVAPSRAAWMQRSAGFLKWSDAAASVNAPVAAWERCASPERIADNDYDDEEALGGSRPRAVSKARSRWTMMEYQGRERSPTPPPTRRWTFDASQNHRNTCADQVADRYNRGRSRERPSPIFSARKTREFLSPKPKRATKFDFDTWGRERGSRSMLNLGLGNLGLGTLGLV